jgi:D-threo-aldose 1-dehydrogenase
MKMDPFELVQVGTTRLQVTRLGMGGAPLGSLFTEAENQVALDTVVKGYDLGVRYFDTAPLYGRGNSETYMGRVLAGIPRDSFVLSSKVGRVLNRVESQAVSDLPAGSPPFEPVFDFSRDGVLRSLEESLQRLGLDHIDIAYIHDPDDHYQQAIDQAFPTLAELRSQGVIGAIGAGMNQWQALARFARDGDFDCFLLAGRYTLLDHSGLEELLPLCQERDISVVLGGPYNSGILASDLQSESTYFYRETPPDVLDRARQIKAICDRYAVPLKAAALQFGLAHPAVAATIPGPRSPAELEENVKMVGHRIPPDLWAELKAARLIPEHAPEPAD